MFSFLREMLCRHDYKFKFKLKGTCQNIYKCKKCNQYLLQHYGLGVICKISDTDFAKYLRRREN